MADKNEEATRAIQAAVEGNVPEFGEKPLGAFKN